MTTSRRLGRYELVEQLGEGGMGAVWLARLTGTGGFEKLCIVKTVLPNIASDKQFVSRFLHEGRVLTQLQHSNIAQVYDMSEDGGTLFLALEFVPGVDLARLQQNVRDSGQPLPLPVALYVMQQVAEGLGFAHRKTALDGTPLGVVHRDVSPQNIMVSYDGEVKVIDFGIAKSEARSHHTAQASVMGKLGYMAPEQASGATVDHRADQYAAAVVLWELLANAPFIARGTLTEMVVAMAHPVPKPLTPLRPDVPATLEKVVMAALSPDPANRFPTTDDFARALQDELLRLAGLPTKRQIGEYVRNNCRGEYAAQQTLLTRVGTMQGVPGVQAVPPTQQDVAAVTGRATPIEPTVLHGSGPQPQAPLPLTTPAGPATAPHQLPTAPARPSGMMPAPQLPLQPQREPLTAPASASPVPEPVPPPGAPRMTTAQLSAAAMPPNRMPLFVGAGVVVVGLVAASAWFVATRVLNKPATKTPEITATSQPTGTATPPPVDPATGPVVAAVVPDVAAVAEGQAGKRTVELFSDGEAWYARAGDTELKAGQVLTVVSADKRTKVGTATVKELFPKMARVELDAAAGAVTGDRFVTLADSAPVPAQPTNPTDVPPPPPTGTATANNDLPPPPPPPTGTGTGAQTAPPPFPSAGTSPGGAMVEVKKAVELFTDGDKTYARAGKADKLAVGQLLVIVGAAEGTKRPKFGTATVMEVLPLMSRVTLDSDARAAGGTLFAAIGPVKDATPTGALEVKKAVELFADGDKVYARAGKNDNLQVGQVLAIVGPATGKLRQKLGTATVMEVQALMSRVILDAAAQAAPEPRFAAVEGGKAEGSSAPTGGKLSGHAKVPSGPIPTIVLINSSGFGWSNCTVYAPGRKKGALKTLGNGFQRELDLRYFTDDPSAPMLNGSVQVNCKEGSGTFPTK